MEFLILTVIVLAVVGVLFAVRKKLNSAFHAPEEHCHEGCCCAVPQEKPQTDPEEPETAAEPQPEPEPAPPQTEPAPEEETRE